MEVVLDSILGAVVGELLTEILKVKKKSAMFKQTMVNLQSALLAIAPVIKDMEQLNNLLDHRQEPIKLLKTEIEAGTKLVCNCAKVHRLNCFARARYQEQLEKLEETLVNFFSTVMQAQMARDQMETLFTLKEVRSVLQKLSVPAVSSSDANSVFAYMITARNLGIAWGDTPRYWKWTSVGEVSSSESQPEVAKLIQVCWLDIRGRIKTSMLSPTTLYGAFFVFKKSNEGAFGFDRWAVEVSVKVAGEGDGQKRTVYLIKAATQPRVPRRTAPRVLNRVCSRFLFMDSSDAAETHSPLANSEPEAEYPKERVDGWMEVKLGDFSSHGGEDKEVDMRVCEVNSNMWKGGILVKGIEIRPN